MAADRLASDGANGGGAQPGPAALRVLILGPVQALRGMVELVIGPARQRAILGLIASDPVGFGRDALVDAIWDDEPPAGAVTMVETAVSRLRHALAAGRTLTGGRPVHFDAGRYRLDPEVTVDWAAFRQLTRRAARREADALACYQQALGLWRGEPFGGLLRSHPVAVAMTEARRRAALAYASLARARGHASDAVDPLRVLAAADPYDEAIHASLIAVLAADGRPAAALRVYQDIRARLRAELGIAPGPVLQAARKAIR